MATEDKGGSTDGGSAAEGSGLEGARKLVLNEELSRKYNVKVYEPCCTFYVDSHEVVEQLRAWLDILQTHFSTESEQDISHAGPIALIVSGFVKTGKSTALGRLLPALVAEHPFVGVDGAARKVICFLDFQTITKDGSVTYRDALSRLLQALRSWAKANKLAMGASADVALQSDEVELEAAIRAFFWEVPGSTLYVINEVHSFFLLRKDPDRQDTARSFLKEILCGMPNRAAVAVTGSSMCLFWSHVAQMPANGVALLHRNYTVKLPASSEAGTSATWERLRQIHGAKLPGDLRTFCPDHPAMLAFLVKEWFDGNQRGVSVYEFVTKWRG